MFYHPQQLIAGLQLYAGFRPAPCLQAHICCYWAVSRPSSAVEAVVPDGCIDLVLSLDRAGGRLRMVLVGPMESPELVNMEHAQWDSFGIRFYPGGLHAFLREPAHLFTGRMERLDAVSRSLEMQLEPLMWMGSRAADRVPLADTLFASLLANPTPWDDTLRNAVYRLAMGAPVQTVAAAEAVSERQLQRLFLERVGLRPKQFSRILRFQLALGRMHTGAPLGAAALAQECGYYDQAHFTREFAALSGVTPAAYLSGLYKTAGRPVL